MAFRQPQPPSQAFDVVGIEDPALDSVPEAILDVYRTERKIEILDEPDPALGWGGLDSLDEKPTRLRCFPLRGSFLEILGPNMDAKDLWRIFAAHCDRIVNLVGENGEPVDTSSWWEGEGEKRKIKSHVYIDNLIPYRLWVDVSNAIIHRGTSGQDSPFIVPPVTSGISRAARDHQSRAKTILTYARSKGTVKETPSA